MTVSPIEGGRILARLQAHFPSLAANDQAAKDWLAEILLTPDPHPIADWMLREWDRDRNPRVSDWVRARRSSVHQAALAAKNDDRLALEAGDPVPPERLRELVSEASRKIAAAGLDEARRPLVGALDRPAWSRLRNEDGGSGLAVRPLQYDELYHPDGSPRENTEEKPE